MSFIVIWETILVFIIGLGGWALFSKLRMPVAPFLGTIFILTFLRALGLNNLYSPNWLFPFLQVCFGIYMGLEINLKVIKDLKRMIVPAMIIVLWALSMVFLLGPLLSWILMLDLFTAFLSFSMAGPAEMTIIALDVDADISFILTVHMIRIIATFSVLPFLLRKWHGNQSAYSERIGEAEVIRSYSTGCVNISSDKNSISNIYRIIYSVLNTLVKFLISGGKTLSDNQFPELFNRCFQKKALPLGRAFFIFLFALVCGTVLSRLGVPAGLMVGALLGTALLSLMGAQPISTPSGMFNILLFGMGISVTDNILPERLVELNEPRVLIFVAISIVIIFASSFFTAIILNRVSGRDLSTCILATAPAGLLSVVALAVEYEKDTLFVSMMLMCRVLSLKIMLPLVFSFLV